MAAEVDGDLPVFEFRPLENSFSRLPLVLINAETMMVRFSAMIEKVAFFNLFCEVRLLVF